MAEADASILQRIRRKEVELSVQVDQARRESEQVIADAKREAADILKNAEAEGARVAEEYHEKRLVIIREEVEDLKRPGEEEAKSARLKGEHNLSKAVDRILRVVSLG
ncbi:MAG: V-type ATPase subunit subunit G family protein [Halobacteriota archaeon]